MNNCINFHVYTNNTSSGVNARFSMIFSNTKREWTLVQDLTRFTALSNGANAQFSMIFSNTQYFKGVKKCYHGVKG